MPDAFLLLAPLLLVPILYLMRFVGCTAPWEFDLTVPAPAVSLSPSSATLGPGESQKFTIQGPATASQDWSVDNGAIDQTGKYTAPDPFDPGVRSASVTLMARLAEESLPRRATANIRLQDAHLAISDPIPLKPGETLQLTATITGLMNQNVTWSSNPAGLIDASGLFTAPAPFSLDLQQATVTAVSQVSNNIRAQVAVTLIGTGARFTNFDTDTHGNWIPAPQIQVYGTLAYSLAAHTAQTPGRKIQFLPLGKLTVIFRDEQPFGYAPNGDGRDLRNPVATGQNDLVLSSVWFSNVQFTIAINFADWARHKLAIYCAAWDGQQREQTIRIFDGDDPTTELARQSITAFDGGIYLLWDIAGHVLIRVEHDAGINAGPNAVVSGIFLD